MNTTKEEQGDQVLQEMWRIKDELSAARGHSVDKMFTGLREREKKSGRRIVNFQTRQGKA